MNKNIRKFTIIVSSLIISASLFAACGNKNKIKENNKTTKTEYKSEGNEYFTDIKWLEENIDNEKLVLLDARNNKDYDKGHIKGAINAPWQGFANMTGKSGDKGWGVLQDEKALSEKFSKLGIDKTKNVVVYGNKDGWGEDGRLVWMFKMAGIDAKMLNGGFDLWKAEKKETTNEIKEPKSTNYKVEKLNNDFTITTEELKSKADKVKIIDTRTKEEYEGATKFGEARGGHLPKAISLPFTEVYNGDGTIKTKEELEKIFKDAGLNKEDEIVTYCTAGIRSAHFALILKDNGYDKVKNYDASFYEWAGDSSNPLEK